MSEPFLAEIKMVGFNFAPRGWALCDGQILPINQNQSLYALMGTTYGGDGRTSFGLPDLRGRTPVHKGEGHQLGQKGGAETVTLTTGEIAAHAHAAKASSTSGNNPLPTNNVRLHLAGDNANLTDLYLYFLPESAINLVWPMSGRVRPTMSARGSSSRPKNSHACTMSWRG